MTDPIGNVVIIGAGPTGLGAAHRLRELRHRDFVVLEARGVAGGLAGSDVDDRGFTWDIGGHVQFSHYAYYDDVLNALPIEWLHHERESWIWIDGRFVPYPFQNNLHRLSDRDCADALAGLERAAANHDSSSTPANFKEWIMATFGDDIARIFLFPYNWKVWAYPPEQLSARWVGERVAMPDLDRIRRNIREHRDDVSWGPNNRFRFPKHGGTGVIWRELAKTFAELQLDASVDRIDAQRRIVHLANGEERRYDTLISSMPLKVLARKIVPTIVSADSLVHSGTHVLGIGLRGAPPESLQKKCWMYFPEPHSPYYRVTVFSNYSPFNVPVGAYWSLMAEVSESPMKPVNHATVFDDVVRALRVDGLIASEDDVVSRWHRYEPFGYPTPSVDRDSVLDAIHRELERHRIFSRGRFGAWKYEVSNQDHSFMQGVELIDHLSSGGEEVTLHRPDYANSGTFLKRDSGAPLRSKAPLPQSPR